MFLQLCQTTTSIWLAGESRTPASRLTRASHLVSVPLCHGKFLCTMTAAIGHAPRWNRRHAMIATHRDASVTVKSIWADPDDGLHSGNVDQRSYCASSPTQHQTATVGTCHCCAKPESQSQQEIAKYKADEECNYIITCDGTSLTSRCGSFLVAHPLLQSKSKKGGLQLADLQLVFATSLLMNEETPHSLHRDCNKCTCLPQQNHVLGNDSPRTIASSAIGSRVPKPCAP